MKIITFFCTMIFLFENCAPADEVSGVTSVAYAPDGKSLAAANGDHTVKIWNVKAREVSRVFFGHTDPVESVTFSPDGKTLASGGLDSTVILWDFATGRQRSKLEAHAMILSVAFSPDGRLLASGDENSTVKLWEVNTGQLRKTLETQAGGTCALAFSPDRRTLVAGFIDGEKSSAIAKFWDVETGQLRTSFDAQTNSLLALALSPDGKALAAGGHDPAIKIWGIANGRCMRNLSGHRTVRVGGAPGDFHLDSSILSLAYSPDGKLLASGAYNESTLMVWDVSSGKVLAALKGHMNRVNSVAFSPDGKTLASGSDDETVKFWDVAKILESQPHP